MYFQMGKMCRPLYMTVVVGWFWVGIMVKLLSISKEEALQSGQHLRRLQAAHWLSA